MAQAKRASTIFGAVTGAALAAGAAFAPMAATAQEVTTVAAPPSQEEQLTQLSAANRAAFAHASEHGVAILLHVGMDIQNHEQPEALLAWVQNEFKQKFAEHGINVGVFPRMNDAPATGLAYHVGDHIYTPEGADSPLLGLVTAEKLIPEVAEQGHLALALIVSERSPDAPAPRS